MKNQLCTLILLGVVLTFHLLFAGEIRQGSVMHGFKLLEKRFVKEVNAECLYFEHVKSGSRLLKMAVDDPNKTFSIAFKTDPESDAGTPHIMEHSVLNGSKNFPVKSPFDILNKGSLVTFLNAFTGNDLTCYPFASMNDKDYFNVMHVYLDAVFNPLILSDERILKQEGWHYELESADSLPVYKGVVYNEMKGAFSSPTRELGYHINKNLFPDNGYRFSSGGYPPAIPSLSYEQFITYYKKYYHPANSYIMLYGNADLDKELAFIDKEYLSKYVQAKRPSSFPLQKPFTQPRETTAFYSAAEGSVTENQTYLTMSVVAGVNTDRATTMALNILCDLLVNQEAGPVRLALLKAGIGQDVSAFVDELHQNVFQIRVQNANPADMEKFRNIVMATLNDVVRNSLDKKAVEGALNRTEFQLREGNDAQKGITYNFQILPGWFFADDPFLTLEYEKPLAHLKTALTTDYLETILKRYIIENPHMLFLTLQPKPGLEKENAANIKTELAKFAATLSAQAKGKLVKETLELIDHQKREDSPQAVASVPMLDRNDITPQASWYDVNPQTLAGVPVLWHEEFTNGVVYARMLFDMRVLPQELIPYAALLAEVLGSQNTEHYAYGDLDVALNIHTGGFSTYLSSYLENQNDALLAPRFVVSAKIMNTKAGKLFELLNEIVNHTRLSDAERLKEIMVRHQARLDAAVKQNGFGYARRRLVSYFSNNGLFNELTSGIEYYRFVTDLAAKLDSNLVPISEKLINTASLLFTKENLTAAVTCSKNDMAVLAKEFPSFAAALPAAHHPPLPWKFELEKSNEGFQTASKVQYVAKGYNFKLLGYAWTGWMRVLDQILSSDWLQNRVRVIGGAYGGFTNISVNGDVLCLSYRDPNLKETLANYDAIPDYLENLQVEDKAMTRYVLGTIAAMDNPLTASDKGDLAVRYFFEKTRRADLQMERDQVIGVTLQDIKSLQPMMADILRQNAICVYGNEDKLQAEKELFKHVQKLSR